MEMHVECNIGALLNTEIAWDEPTGRNSNKNTISQRQFILFSTSGARIAIIDPVWIAAIQTRFFMAEGTPRLVRMERSMSPKLPHETLVAGYVPLDRSCHPRGAFNNNLAFVLETQKRSGSV